VVTGRTSAASESAGVIWQLRRLEFGAVLLVAPARRFGLLPFSRRLAMIRAGRFNGSVGIWMRSLEAGCAPFVAQ